MSVWTHVAAVFRIEGVRDAEKFGRVNGEYRIDWDKVTGRAIRDLDWCSQDDYEREMMEADWAAYRKHPKRFMPTGSEGSLQRHVHVGRPYVSPRYTVTVEGDLRDHDDHEAIRAWFDSVCDRCHIRQAICECDVSGDVHVWQR